MKNALISLLLATSILTISSCKKKEPTPPAPTPASGASITAKVAGVPKSWTGSSCYYWKTTETKIAAIKGIVTELQLDLSGIFTPGTYPISMQVQALYSSESVSCQADAGSITISSIVNNKISGTFSFSETGGIAVTNGVFTDVPKQ